MRLNGIIFLAILVGTLALEFHAHVFERGIGLYLKWQNHNKPQLGRVWERDRQNIVAQHKVQSILSTQHLQEQSAESIGSIGQLFQNLAPISSLVVSRKKFLDLYYDYPGQWFRRIISPFDLIKIDARKNWDRVLFIRFGTLFTFSFIDSNNMPISQMHLTLEELAEIQSTRTIQRGRLEETGIEPDRIFSFKEFIQVLQTLDSASQKALFPDPQWFMERNYYVTRVGFSDAFEGTGQPLMFAIEYDTDYYPSVLLIPVPLEMANNVLSQIERNGPRSRGNYGGTLEGPQPVTH